MRCKELTSIRPDPAASARLGPEILEKSPAVTSALGPLSPTLTRLLLLMTFLESVGTVLLQRGLYFYTSTIHGSTSRENL